MHSKTLPIQRYSLGRGLWGWEKVKIGFSNKGEIKGKLGEGEKGWASFANRWW